MFNKSFISIYFTQNQILVALLDSKRKKLKKYANATIPPGLVSNYRVTDPGALAKILKGIWSKLRIKQKSVGIVLPEYSTFIKILKLSNINLSEIHEALNWQLAEVLPYPLEEAVTDWKILKKEDKEYTVLSVSIEKSVLNTYLAAFDEAELFPIIVEIPSVCISRISEEKNALIIYVNNFDATFVMLSDGMLVGSSVVEGNDPSDIAQNVARILSHYKDVKTEKILLFGTEIDTSKISQKVKIPVSYTSKLFGDGNKDLQNFLVPGASQMQEPTVPTDPFSLNLIPNDLIGKYRSARVRLQVWSMSLAITLFVSISFLSALAGLWYVSISIAQVKTDLSNLNQTTGNRQQLLGKIKEMNETSNKIIGIKQKTFSTSEIVNKINSSAVPGLTINSFRVDLEKATVAIVGIAGNRQNLVDFRTNLEKVEVFEKPEIPVSSFEKESNLDFEILIKYKPAAPEKKGVKSDK